MKGKKILSPLMIIKPNLSLPRVGIMGVIYSINSFSIPIKYNEKATYDITITEHKQKKR
jgi:hypothetical protein